MQRDRPRGADVEGEQDRFEEVERELITRVLRHTDGHQGRACTLLGIDRKTLRSKMRDLGIALERVVTDRTDSPDE